MSNKESNNAVLKNIPIVVSFLVICSFTYFLSDAKIFQEFMPRSVCMFHNENLIHLHLISDIIIFISYAGMGLLLWKLFNSLKDKIPFSDYFWKFGGFIFFCGLTHLVAVINLYITFYWIDGIIKLITCWFSVLVFFALLRDFKKLSKIRSPQQWNELTVKMGEVVALLKKSA